MLKTASWLVAAAAAATLFVAPAFADDAKDMKSDKPMAHKTMHHKWDCMDYAYQSQAAKDCMAKQDMAKDKPMAHKSMHHKMMKKKDDMKDMKMDKKS